VAWVSLCGSRLKELAARVVGVLAFFNPYPPFMAETDLVKTHHRWFVLAWAGSINCKHL